MQDRGWTVGCRVVMALALLAALVACGGERGEEDDLTLGPTATATGLPA